VADRPERKIKPVRHSAKDAGRFLRQLWKRCATIVALSIGGIGVPPT
jgi:hypothetical protein